MVTFQSIFLNRHTILPVIHVESPDQTLRNADIAFKSGCDGVFLINHGMDYASLLEVHRETATMYPDRWTGVNCLGLHPMDVFQEIDETVLGVWVDNAYIDENAEGQPEADQIQEVRCKSGWVGLYFGGVAFKYQRKVEDLERASRVAARYMDVVTTSGPGTGQAATREKIATMKRAIGDFPLAIASGITPENVGDYLDIADCFLVATGISSSFTELDPALVTELCEKIRSYQGI